ncbi:DNA-directed RNA polymerase III subunit rpc3 [Pycnococcus provasolii]
MARGRGGGRGGGGRGGGGAGRRRAGRRAVAGAAGVETSAADSEDVGPTAPCFDTLESSCVTLAGELLEERFGDVVTLIARALLKRGTLNMHDLHAAVNLDAAARSRSQRLSSIPSLSLEVVRASVELLIQHNCVYCVERRVARTTNQQSEALSASAKGKSAATSSSIVTYAYACSAHRVCQRLSYPAFLMHARDEMGSLAELIVRILIEHGRLSYARLATKVAGELQCNRTDDVLYVFRAMVEARFVERAPGRGTPAADMPKREPKSGSGGGPRSGSKIFAEEHLQTFDDGPNMPNLMEKYQQVRFLLPPELESGPLLGDGNTPADDPSLAEEQTRSGRKRVRAVVDDDDDEEAADEPANKASRGDAAAGPSSKVAVRKHLVRWRVNHDEFLRRMRHAEIASNVQNIYGHHAAAAVATLLCAHRSNENFPPQAEDQTIQLGGHDAAELTRQHRHKASQVAKRTGLPTTISAASAGGAGAGAGVDAGSGRTSKERETYPNPPSDIEQQLQEMSRHPLQIVRPGDEGPTGPQYCVSTKRAIHILQSHELEAMIKSRFGELALRCYRILTEMGIFNSKMIADRVLVCEGEVNQVMYQLLREGWVQCQEIVPDNVQQLRDPNAWRYDFETQQRHFTAQLHTMASHLIQRLRHVTDTSMSIVDDDDDGKMIVESLTDGQKLALKRAKMTCDNIEMQLMMVARLLRLFADM